MIVTHHPVLFRATKTITSDTIEGRLLLDLIEAEIAVYSPHTAFDNADLAINQWLAESLGLDSTHRCAPFFSKTFPVVWSRRCICHSANKTGIPRTTRRGCRCQVSGSGMAWRHEHVSRVGLACGSAAEYLSDALQANCDTFVTGEARFHSAVECQSQHVNLVLSGHFSSERPGVVKLAQVLATQLSGVECFASEEDRDPLECFVSNNNAGELQVL